MNKRLFCGIMVLALVCVGNVVIAQGEQEEKQKEEFRIVTKDINGVVGTLTSTYISVTYDTNEEKGTEYEMMLWVDDKTEYIRKAPEEIIAGDRVNVKYDELYKKDEEGVERAFKRVVREVRCLGPGVKALRSE
ncbi:MAG: hypothetical protein V2A72_05380 [Candidatus Omnitrophota bacterium]